MEHDGSDGERPKSLNLGANRRPNEWLGGNCHPLQRKWVAAFTEGGGHRDSYTNAAGPVMPTAPTKGARPPDADGPDLQYET